MEVNRGLFNADKSGSSGKIIGGTLVLDGIPQGSVLGHWLFVYFIIDMPEVVHSTKQMFADDTKIYCDQ